MKKRRFISLLCVLVMAISMLSGCGSKTTESGKVDSGKVDSTVDKDELEYVELNWYVTADPKDTKVVQAALDEYFLEKLNCKVNLVCTHYVTYYENISTQLQAGDEIDMCTMGSLAPVESLEDAGAFYPLNELLDKYGKETKALFKDEVWESLKSDGNIYMVPALKDNAYILSFIYNDTLADAIGLDYENTDFATFSEMEDYLLNAKKLRDKKFPEYADMALINDNRNAYVPFYFKLERFISGTGLAVSNIAGYEVDASRGADEVYNFYETDEFREHCLSIQRLVEAGVMQHPDRMVNISKEPSTLFDAGWGYTYLDEHAYSADFVSKLKFLEGTWTDAANYASAGVSIAATCKDPERAMMVIELANTDPYLATMLRFGVEGEHWEYDEDGKMQFANRNADPANMEFLNWYGVDFGNLTIVEGPESYTGPDNAMLTRMAEFNDEAVLASHMDFVVDVSEISNELAACQSVVTEYNYLITGALESQDAVNKAVDEFVAKLKANGSEKIVTEIQEQLDAHLAAK